MAWLFSFSEHPKSPSFKHPLDVRNILAPGIQLKYYVQGTEKYSVTWNSMKIQCTGCATKRDCNTEDDRGFKMFLTHVHNNTKQFFMFSGMLAG